MCIGDRNPPRGVMMGRFRCETEARKDALVLVKQNPAVLPGVRHLSDNPR